MVSSTTHESETDLTHWRKRIFVTAWITYASLYLGRVNLAVALPALQDGLGLTKTEAGWIGGAFFWAYATGQLVNGLLGDRVNSRVFVTLGLITSALINLCFGFAGHAALLAILWAMNGYVQSTGWAPMVALLSRWFDPEARSRVTAFFGPCYNLGNVASWLLAGWLVSRVGWRAAFWVPSLLLAISAIHWWARVRNDPESVGLPSSPHTQDRRKGEKLWRQLGESLRYLLKHSHLRRIALACIGMGVVKEGFAFWIPTFLHESAGIEISRAVSYAIFLPLAGSLGIMTSGWISERFFHSNEVPVIVIFMTVVGVTMLAYPSLIGLIGIGVTPLALGVIGAAVHGANTLVVTSLPLSYTAQGRVSSVSGFFGFASYVGSLVGGVMTGVLVDRTGWDSAFGFWALAGLTSAAIAASLYVRKQRREKAY